MAKYKLTQEILTRSRSKNWDEAKLEWKLSSIEKNEDTETCLCGHFPIVEVCILVNKYSGSRVRVGNCCVNKFLGLNSDKLFQTINRVSKDRSKSFNAEVIDLSFQKRWINDWEKKFYLDIRRKIKLTPKQLKFKIPINNKILFKIIKVVHKSAIEPAYE